jgi:GT2 family glycosyltransferase
MSRVGVVAIGRNEGERLRACLASALRTGPAVVYVDSGSSDPSVGLARCMGVEVVELDMSVPFSAARARNAGMERLWRTWPQIEHVMFLDGDCEIVEGWIERAAAGLDARTDAAVACGRRRERYPEASIYNKLCDMEWASATAGEVNSCGGDALMRITAVAAVGGYDPSVVAGEEPEMCLRLRRAGWKIIRLDAEMTLHDAAMTRFSQWWRRSIRSGHAYAQGMAMHGASPERHYVRESTRIWIWALAVPIIIVGAALVTRGWGAILMLVYLLLMAKIAFGRMKRGDGIDESIPYAFFTVLMKWAQLIGQIKYFWRHLRGGEIRIVEYRGPVAGGAGSNK